MKSPVCKRVLYVIGGLLLLFLITGGVIWGFIHDELLSAVGELTAKYGVPYNVLSPTWLTADTEAEGR